MAKLGKGEIFTQLTEMMQSAAWKSIIKPSLKNRISDLTIVLIDELDEKGKPLSPADIAHCRALIKALSWVLNWENTLETLSREIEANLDQTVPRRLPFSGSLYDQDVEE